jgi:hypothetical protein
LAETNNKFLNLNKDSKKQITGSVYSSADDNEKIAA